MLKLNNCERINAEAQEGKELDPPVPPRCRDRVNSLYLPAGSFPAPGDPNSFTSGLEEQH